MTAKRALVVDDSRSARISLQKMLERYQIVVDFAESGEEALDYLRHQVVDAIFMDHTMPGMDGLETVVAIKSNPRTATIPVMMYTASDGEVYVSQARALGAIGVMPKQVQPGVLDIMLRKLGLLEDGVPVTLPEPPVRAANSTGPASTLESVIAPAATGTRDAGRVAPVADAARVVPPETRATAEQQADAQAIGASLQAMVGRTLAEQHIQLRSDILTSHRDFARQVAQEILERQPGTPEPASVPPGPGVSRQANILVLLLLFGLAALGFGYWQLMQQRNSLQAELAAVAADGIASPGAATQSPREMAAVVGRAVRETRTQWLGVAGWALNQNPLVAYAAPAFDDQRAVELEALLERLSAAGFRGTVRVEAHLGAFCLAESVAGEWRLAPAGMPIDQCARIGHPLDDSTDVAARQSAVFASFMANSPLVTGNGIEVELVAKDRTGSVTATPMPADVTTAGAWNEIARQNHRLRISLVPAS